MAGSIGSVLYDFAGSSDEGTLAVKAGDRITIVVPDGGDGWIEAELEGTGRGAVPSSYVEILPDEPAPVERPASIRQSAKVEATVDEPAPVQTPAPEPERELVVDEDDASFVGTTTQVMPGWVWASSDELEITVTSPEIHKGGMGKGFVVYTVTTIPGGTSVQRRYKDFLWVQGYLHTAFPNLAVPPLPPKQQSGRFEDEFIEGRRVRLEQFLMRVARHPVMRVSEGFELFLATESDKEFVQSKRMLDKVVEKDGGGQFLRSIRVSEKWTDAKEEAMTKHLDKFKSQLQHFDTTVAGLKDALATNQKSLDARSKEEKKTSSALSAFAGPAAGTNPLCWREECGCMTLADNLRNVSKHFQAIHELTHRQDAAYQTLLDQLEEYNGALPTIASMLKARDSSCATYHSLRSKVARNPNAKFEEKRKANSMQNLMLKSSYSAMCEQELFHRERLLDLQKYFSSFLKSQEEYYRKVADTFRESVEAVQQINVDVGDKSTLESE